MYRLSFNSNLKVVLSYLIKEDELGLVLLDLWCAKIKNIDIFEIVSHIEQYGKTWFLSMKWVTLAVMEFWS